MNALVDQLDPIEKLQFDLDWRAIRVLNVAAEYAGPTGKLMPAHIMLGLTRFRDDISASILSTLGITHEIAANIIRKTYCLEQTNYKFEITPATLKLIYDAKTEFTAWNMDRQQIGTEHLLLAALNTHAAKTLLSTIHIQRQDVVDLIIESTLAQLEPTELDAITAISEILRRLPSDFSRQKVLNVTTTNQRRKSSD